MNHAFQDIKTQLPTVLAQCNLDIVVPSDHAHRSLMRTPRTGITPMLWESFKKYIFFFRFCLFVQKDVRLFLAAAVPFWLPFFVLHPILPPFHLPISLRYAVFLSSVFPAKKTLPFRHFELGYFPFISTPQPPELHVSRFVRVQVHVCVCVSARLSVFKPTRKCCLLCRYALLDVEGVFFPTTVHTATTQLMTCRSGCSWWHPAPFPPLPHLSLSLAHTHTLCHSFVRMLCGHGLGVWARACARKLPQLVAFARTLVCG